ncbi:MAG: A24 family peptidase [Gammaproteobacteria bacterium]|nr:A24 family peptidase [Gammaproteobacteria bacterium]
MQSFLAIYPPQVLILFAGILGLLVGSFLNVVIYRLPVMMERGFRVEATGILNGEVAALKEAEAQSRFNLVVPRSRCPKCKTQITAVQNIPVISWLVLRGKCAHCKMPVSARYPVIEAVTGMLTALIIFKLGANWAGIGGMLLLWSLIALTMIDYDTQLLPDQITLPLVWSGIIFSMIPHSGVFPATDLQSSIFGAIGGYLALWSIYWGFKLITKKDGMGYGDFKLLAALGAWLGWQLLPAIILLSAVVGALTGIAMILFSGHKREVPIPFGPYLAGAGILAMLWGEELNMLLGSTIN